MHGCSRGGMHGCSWGGMHGCCRGGCGCSPGGGMRGFIWGGHVWFYSGGHAWFYSGGHAWFYSGGMRGFIRGHAWFYSGGACMVLFRGGMRGFFSFFRIQWDTVNERAVRILLECNLVYNSISWYYLQVAGLMRLGLRHRAGWMVMACCDSNIAEHLLVLMTSYSHRMGDWLRQALPEFQAARGICPSTWSQCFTVVSAASNQRTKTDLHSPLSKRTFAFPFSIYQLVKVIIILVLSFISWRITFWNKWKFTENDVDRYSQ